MVSEAPDPKIFQSWEEAFQYPIPAVRGMERQLRRDIDSNREKLRTLVGASYRDLLGTAESIIEMDSKMQDVETLMGEIGRKCNTRVIERKGTNLKTWSGEVCAKDNALYAFTSQLAVLRSCPGVIAQLLKTGSSLLLAAKVLIISRLLHTKLSSRPNAPPYLETLRNRLATLRRRLLAKTDRRFKNSNTDKEGLVEAMCAFSLATSSSPTDVVRHFQHLRLEAMSECVEEGSASKQSNILLALRLYVKTLQDTRAIVPGQLSLALQSLKATPIFRSQDLEGVSELNLDIHERWIGDDIKSFTLYIRHEELSRAEAEKSLKAWAKTAVKAFLVGLKTRVLDIHDPEMLLQLRREVLEVWLSQHQHNLGVDAGEVLDGLRDVFITRAVQLIRKRAQGLETVGSMIDRTAIHDWRPEVSDHLQSLWSPAMTSMDTSHGAKGFRQKLINLSAGKNDLLLAVCERYLAWLKGVERVEKIIHETRKFNWADDLNDVEDDDDNLLDDKQVLLSEDDPRVLQEALNDELKKAFSELDKVFPSEPSGLAQEYGGHQAIFILRILREIRVHLPNNIHPHQLGEKSIPILLHSLSTSAITPPLQSCSKRLQKFHRAGSLPTRALWEGDSELPVLPSPWAYRFILELTQSMASFGADIWSPEAVRVLKIDTVGKLVEILEQASQSSVQENGDIKPQNLPPKPKAIRPDINVLKGHQVSEGGQIFGSDSLALGRITEGNLEDLVGKTVNEFGEILDEDGDVIGRAGVISGEAADKLQMKHVNGTGNGTGLAYADGDEIKSTNAPDGHDANDLVTIGESHVNGTVVNGSDSYRFTQEKNTQKLFDVFYLGNAMAVKKAKESSLQSVQDSLVEAVELETESIELMKKGAAEYWKRTSLLFGLLA